MTTVPELGDMVYYHHLAAVARHFDGWWNVVEGCMPPRESDMLGAPFASQPQARMPYGALVNKTILVWPETGFGIIIGRVRRGIGESVRGSRGHKYFGEDWEPGYFVADSWHRLYVVKHQLEGMHYVLVPEWGVALA